MTMNDARPEPLTSALAGRREWVSLSVLLLPLLMVSMDVSVLYFAVPFLAHDLHPTATQQLWVFDVYGFVLAALLLTMGALGDRIGRRRLLLIGVAGFAAASLFAAYAGSAGTLIAARALLGVAGATLMPSTLALVRTMFTDERQRGKAIAIWTAVMSGGVALGPVLSGVLLEHFWWGSVFLINLPAMVLLLVLGPILLPEHRQSARRLDVVGSVLSLGAVLGLTYGFKQWAVDGFGWLDLGCVLVGLALAAGFVVRLRAARHPMIEVALFRRTGFGVGVVHNVLAMFALVGNATLITQYLQSVLGLSPLRAALWSIAPSVFVGAAAPLAAALAQRRGRTVVVAGGFVTAALGFFVLSWAPARTGLAIALTAALIGATLIAVGIVAVLTLVTEAAMIAMDPAQAGTATAVLETGSELGGALGIAVLGSIAAAVYRGRMADSSTVDLPASDLDQARRTLAGALDLAQHSPAGPALISAGRSAFVSGMHTADLVAAALLVLAAAATRLVRSRHDEADASDDFELDERIVCARAGTVCERSRRAGRLTPSAQRERPLRAGR